MTLSPERFFPDQDTHTQMLVEISPPSGQSTLCLQGDPACLVNSGLLEKLEVVVVSGVAQLGVKTL